MTQPLLLLLLLVPVVAVALARAHANVPGALLDAWAAQRGIELTQRSRPIVVRYLRRSRVLRTWGAVAGALLPSLVELAWSGRLQILGFGADGTSAPLAGPIGAYVGYLAGALCAELSLARPATAGARRAASIVPRELHDYLPRELLLSQRALGALAAIGSAMLAVVPYDGGTGFGWRGATAAAAVVLVFAGALEALQRWLVRRPQPFLDASLSAADDAIRAQSIHALAGGGMALLLVVCCGIFLGLAASDVALLRWTMWLPALLALVGSVRACMQIAHRGWRVRRAAGASPRSAPT